MYQWCEKLFPLNRSLSGLGNLQTLEFFKSLLPELEIGYIDSGEDIYDWVVPEEWNVNEAYIETLDGRRIVDWAESNLHLVGYSIPVDMIVERDVLLKKIHFSEVNDEAIPYKTSYYNRDWGFCVSKKTMDTLNESHYKVVIDSSFRKGKIVYGEVVIPGLSKKEILLSSYICHPSLANNELSGPVVLMALLLHLKQIKERYYTYRVSFHPETIGAIALIKRRNLDQNNPVVAAWNFTCMGGPSDFSIMPSKYPNSFPERITLQALENLKQTYKIEEFLQRGSDERQFTSPGVEIPTVSLMRSMYGLYDEYHTSLDNLEFISQANLNLSLEAMIEILRIVEETRVYKSVNPCEPFLSKHKLQFGIDGHHHIGFRDVLNVHAYCDGKNTLDDISKYCQLELETVAKICDRLQKIGIIF